MPAAARRSNLELLRIVAMFLIVLHHYCVNSGFVEIIDLHYVTYNTILLQFMAVGGKVGVNLFLLISGYFMIDRRMKWEKVVKLFSQILFYNVLVVLFLSGLGYTYGIRQAIKDITPLLFSIKGSFVANYLLVYILSPVINKGLKTLSKKEFLYLLGILLFYFSILSTFLNRDTWDYFGWAFTMYCCGAFIKTFGYGARLGKKQLLLGGGICIFCMWAIEIFVDFIGAGHGITAWEYGFVNANKLPVFLLAVFMFLLFNKMHVAASPIINRTAACTLGVLLIHANSPMMRQWLWTDLLHNTDYFHSPYLFIHMSVSVAAIYIVCTLIETARLRYIETPLFQLLNKRKITSQAR